MSQSERDETLGTCKAAYTPEYSMFWNVSASGSVGTDGTQEGEEQQWSRRAYVCLD